VFFIDEMNFYLNPPISNQNSRVWTTGKKDDVKPSVSWSSVKSLHSTDGLG